LEGLKLANFTASYIEETQNYIFWRLLTMATKKNRKMNNQNNVPANQNEAVTPAPDETPEKPEKIKLGARLKQTKDNAINGVKDWSAKHPKTVKTFKVLGTGIAIAGGVVAGLFCANEIAKRSDSDSEETTEGCTEEESEEYYPEEDEPASEEATETTEE
jgi:hypothetical protein